MLSHLSFGSRIDRDHWWNSYRNPRHIDGWLSVAQRTVVGCAEEDFHEQNRNPFPRNELGLLFAETRLLLELRGLCSTKGCPCSWTHRGLREESH